VIDFDTTGPDPFGKEKEASTESLKETDGAGQGRAVVRGFLIVSLIAALFLGYGIFMYFAIGDKGPPDWDFGSIEDTPGQSVYSTGRQEATEAQHVDRKPEPPAGEGGQ
jgi:hypothetical protein